MGKSQSLEMQQRQQLRFTQQQLRFVRLLEMTAPELDEAVERELDENPALTVKEPEEKTEAEPRDETPYYLRRAHNREADYEPYTPQAVDDSVSLYDVLNEQISEKNLPTQISLAAQFIIGSLDSNGYLRRPLYSLIDDMAVTDGLVITEEEAKEAVKAVQSLDPPGIGATDLQECLRLQLERMPKSYERDLALRIITEQFDLFTKKHTHKLIAALKAESEDVTEALKLILSLNPKPGSAVGSGAGSAAAVIVPDVFIDNEDGRITLSLNSRFPELTVEQDFENALKQFRSNKESQRSKQGAEFIAMKVNNARDFIRTLKRRQETLLAVVSAIVKIQREYFLTEDVSKLRPMMMKDISELTGLDLSAISRSTNNKYAATPWGIYPLRYFFSEAVVPETETTDKGLKEHMRRLIDAEDKRHPLSDETIREMMEAAGHPMSRRTVAKYRDAMGIPVARLRREMLQ